MCLSRSARGRARQHRETHSSRRSRRVASLRVPGRNCRPMSVCRSHCCTCWSIAALLGSREQAIPLATDCDQHGGGFGVGLDLAAQLGHMDVNRARLETRGSGIAPDFYQELFARHWALVMLCEILQDVDLTPGKEDGLGIAPLRPHEISGIDL